MSEKTSCITINCGCCGSNMTGTESKGDGNPVGTVIAYMGTKAPLHYLACNGAMLNIADYQALSDQILDEFGAVDYFGGDGTTTFALPDLRNEFLRGYHGEAENQLSGEIGIHQEATTIPTFQTYRNSGSINYPGKDTTKDSICPTNTDYMTVGMQGCRYVETLVSSANTGTEGASGLGKEFTTRPTNVAILYCIKYE